MRIAIVGYGKMGKMVRQAVEREGHSVVAVIDPYSTDREVTAKELSVPALSSADVVIEFSVPSSVMEHFAFYAKAGCRVVLGTTGWYDKLPEVRKMGTFSSSTIIYSGNFSLGVAVFQEVVRTASRLLSKVGGYDSGVFEMHHQAKADSPSGTALMLASSILDNSDKTTTVSETLHRKREEGEIQVASLRVGSVCGTHTVYFDSPADTIELTHRARTREGFAFGAVKAAGWLLSQKPGLYTLDDMTATLFTQEI